MSLTFEGRIWLVVGPDGDLIDDIDTDQIFHNAHLAITDVDLMGQHALGNLGGWENFSSEVAKGDILVFGENFGAGSSRQQAVDCFISLGIACIIARSYGAIYRRNAINSALPILELHDFDIDAASTGDRIVVDIDIGTIEFDGKVIGTVGMMSSVQRDIMDAGNIFLYAERMEGNE